MPGSLRFYPDEVEQIEEAQLILLGIPPSEIERMSLKQRYNVLEISAAQNDPKKYVFGK